MITIRFWGACRIGTPLKNSKPFVGLRPFDYDYVNTVEALIF